MNAVRLKVFITGASSGIGLALAEEYVAARGRCSASSPAAPTLSPRSRPAHPHNPISIYPADVRDADALADAARASSRSTARRTSSSRTRA